MGPIELWAADHRLETGQPRQRAVLAALLVDAGRVVPVETLIDRVWGEEQPEHARRVLHSHISRVRHLLSQADAEPSTSARLAREPGGYLLRVDEEQIDGHRFRLLLQSARDRQGLNDVDRTRLIREALTLWRGQPLAGVPGEWAAQVRAGWTAERVDAVVEWARIELRQGNPEEVLAQLTGLTAEHPLVEPLVEVFMRALHATGRSAEALDRYAGFRRQLAEGLGVDPSPVLQRLHLSILRGEPLQADTDAVTSVPAPRATGTSAPAAGPTTIAGSDVAVTHRPRTLPRQAPDFTGRSEIIARVAAAVRAGDRRSTMVQLIDGMPGSGKTTLAVQLAVMLQDDYPDGQLFIDLHGHSARDPMDPRAALSALLQQMEVPPDRLPVDFEGRVAYWRTLLSGRRLVLVLDNAGSSAQIAPLLPTAPGSLTLITSRRRLGLDSVQLEPLPLMTAAEATELLARIAGSDRVAAEPAATSEVVHRCGYLPLAIRLAGTRLAHRPNWRVGDLAARLRGDGPTLPELTAETRTVAAAFALSCAQLSPPAHRVFRLLSLHTGADFDACAAAALVGLPLPRTQHLLDELVDSYLVEEPTVGRYRLHDLVREYAFELCTATDTDDERHAAVEGLLDFYLHAADVARRSIESVRSRRFFAPGSPRRPDLVEELGALPSSWCAVERRNLAAAVALAMDTGCYHYVWRLARVCWRYLYHAGSLDELIALQEQALAAARKLGDDEALTASGNYLASAYFRQGRTQRCLDFLEPAMAAGQRLGNKAWLAVLHGNMSIAYLNAGRHPEAVEHALQALRELRDTVEPDPDVPRLLSGLGEIYAITGRYEEGLLHLRRALFLAVENGDQAVVAGVLRNIGSIRSRQGAHRYAKRLLTASLLLYRRLDTGWGEGEVLNDLASNELAKGRPDLAAQKYHEVIPALRDKRIPGIESAAHNGLGRAALASGDVQAAREHFEHALELVRETGHRREIAMSLDGIACCLAATEPHRARVLWQRALKLLIELDMPERFEVEKRLAEAERRRPAAR
ncbi:BTAD domain-containing putative transcriptional regulator [Micromonospora andamanensis]|uniref:SARP family transcriptional regulator n=1 Tax=Micromonospora andamanensis TaxID=1287068 RepID=A0ABQ4HXW5_9ACTN|nr:BTAD domain-containing putative transcriptional regulator [Micromonospora andamanensis]GIJ10464.1 SARP family transcriptional regulator [Micromonospora andamanensis]